MLDEIKTVISGPGFFRLVLAYAVIVSHSSRLMLGTGAVFLFFVLSGYWITVMWQERYSRADKPYFVYLVSRAWRLLPTFWLVSAIAFIGAVAQGGPPSEFYSWQQLVSNTVLLGYSALDFKLITTGWSLDVEMQFYIVAPAIIALLGLSTRRGWLVVVALASIISLASWEFYPKGTIIQNAGLFAAGIAAAACKWKPEVRQAAWGAGIALLMIVGTALSPWRGILLSGRPPTEIFLEHGSAYGALLAACLAPYAILTTQRKGGRHDRMFGDISYIVYLLHLTVLYWMGAWEGSFAYRSVMTLSAFAVIFAGGWLIWRYVDYPVNRLRARWVEERLRRRAASELGQTSAEISGP